MSSTEVHQSAGYRRPARAILDVLDAPPPPGIIVSPTRDYVLLAQSERYPPIADVAAPMVRLAGLRIDPRTNGPHLPPRIVGLTRVSIRDGEHRPFSLPAQACFSQPIFSADGRSFVCTNAAPNGTELWVGDVAAIALRRIEGVRVSAVHGPTVQWLPDQRSLICQTVPRDRGAPPIRPPAPVGPVIQESHGSAAPVRTYSDLLKNPHDEDLFDYYATAQLAVIDVREGGVVPIGRPGIFADVDPSSDGRYTLILRIHRPYSYLYTAGSFPHDIEVWDCDGNVVTTIAQLPLQDRVPIEGVPTGPRIVQWYPHSPARLLWIEALDNGDPKNIVPHRDRLMELDEPFSGPAREVLRIEHRFAGLLFAESGRFAWIRDYDRDRRWSRTLAFDPRKPEKQRIVWSRSVHDRYGDPGFPVMRALPSGKRVILDEASRLFMIGSGASPTGDRPFLDRYDGDQTQLERLFHCSDGEYEAPLTVLEPSAALFLTRHESPTSPPNLFVRRPGGEARPITQFRDPSPQLRGITKRLVTYQRSDGVPLSFTLYLPADYQAGTRLPTVVWAYPQEFNSADTAGQVAGSPNRFTTITGPSHLFFLLAGYAVLDGATMPVVGDPEKANDTFIEQTVASAQAAIEQAVALGVADRERVGIGGHSYGAFMTANLLAHSELFRAGIARSGAFNRTLTPFGFQNERRTFWEASDVYRRMSPFHHVHQIKAPLLLIHGAADNNPGTFPMQSERMFQAVRGTGGIVRYVELPFESHGYMARESIEHVLYEMIAWFDQYVKGSSS